MTWLLRFFAWATALAVPTWAFSLPYQRALAAVATRVLGWLGLPVDVTQIQLQAPTDLGLFAAMCLASRRSSLPLRARALVLGLPALVVIEIVVVVLGICFVLPFRGRPDTLNTALGIMGGAIQTVPWVSAALVWFVFLGAREIPAARKRSGESLREGAAREGAARAGRETARR